MLFCRSFSRPVSTSPVHKRSRQDGVPAAGPSAGPRRSLGVQALSTLELTQGFLAHEEQLALLQAQCAAVYKLPADGHLGRTLLQAVSVWQKDHKPVVAHAINGCVQHRRGHGIAQ